jgi:hypothetical protein
LLLVIALECCHGRIESPFHVQYNNAVMSINSNAGSKKDSTRCTNSSVESTGPYLHHPSSKPPRTVQGPRRLGYVPPAQTSLYFLLPSQARLPRFRRHLLLQSHPLQHSSHGFDGDYKFVVFFNSMAIAALGLWSQMHGVQMMIVERLTARR